MNQILMQDFAAVANSNLPFEEYRNKTFLITGATGLVGSLLVKTLLYCNHVKDLNLTVLAAVRNPDKAKHIFHDVPGDVLRIVKWDLTEGGITMDDSIDFIIHTAAITNSKQMVTDPVGTIQTSIIGTKNVLELAREKKASMVYVSSMEMYGNPNLSHKVTEEDFGYIDLSNVRSCYPESKRMCECLCTAYCAQFGVQVCTARLAQTFGAGILPTENRVFAQFARSAMHGENIVLHTTGESEGNYVYTSDAIRALLLLLVRGKCGQSYNVVNEENHMTIADMAHMVAETFGQDKTQVVFDIPQDSLKYGYAPATKMHLSAEKIAILGWKAEIDLPESYRRVIEYLKDFE